MSVTMDMATTNLLSLIKESVSILGKAKLKKEFKSLSLKDKATVRKEHNNNREDKKEKRGIYNVTYNGKNSTLIRKADLESFVKYQKGRENSRGGSGSEHIQKHLEDGSVGYITKEEVLQVGEVIQKGLFSIDDDDGHIYTKMINDGHSLRVVVGLNKKGERIISFHTTRNWIPRSGDATSEQSGETPQATSLNTTIPQKESEVNIDEATTQRLSKIKDVLTSEDFTLFDLKSLNRSITKIEEVEDSLQNNELYQEVIGLYNQAIDRLSNDVTTDSIDDGLFDTVTMDKATNEDADKVKTFVLKRVPSAMKKDIEVTLSKGMVYIKYNENLTDQQRKLLEVGLKNAVRKVDGEIDYTHIADNKHQWEVSMDSIDFGDVTMDTANRVREFQTYKAWERAVKKIDPKADFTGDKDIDGAFKKDVHDSEWDGESGEIVTLDAIFSYAELLKVKPTEPTEKQKEAGNYKKFKIKVKGREISIENPAGSGRFGTDTDGKKWSIFMQDHYGYFNKTVGADGDHIDVFVNSDANEEEINNRDAFTVHQNDVKTGEYDEDKVILGCRDEDHAKEIYLRNYNEGYGGFGSIEKIEDLELYLGATFNGISKMFTKHVMAKTEAETQKIKDANPTLDAVSPQGTYISRKVSNTKQLKEWVEKQGLTPVNDFHTTIMYSKKTVDLGLKEDEITVDKITGFGRLGKENVLVLFFKSRQLTARHNQYKRNGATFDYDTYKPHITISLDDKEIKDLPDFKITLGKEVSKPIKADFKYKDA